MDILDATYITEQNKIASGGAWIWLLEIATAGYSTLRYTNDNARNLTTPSNLNITWNGNTYWSIPFAMDDVNFSTSGEFPEYKLQIGEVDLSGTLRTRIKSTAGLVGSTLRLMVVHSDHLDLTTPAIDELTEILNCELTAEAVIFTIGFPSLLSRRFPKDRYVPGFCRHKFGLALCQYVRPISLTYTSNQIEFTADDSYNTIWANEGELITNLFRHVPGEWICPGNLITNGAFEKGVTKPRVGWSANSYASDWNTWGSTEQGAWYNPTERRWSINPTPDRIEFGERCYYHINPNPPGGFYHPLAGIRQRIYSLTQGGWYTVSCWVYPLAILTEGIQMRIENTDTSGNVVAYASIAGVWQRLAQVFYMHHSSIPYKRPTVLLGGDGVAYFDNVTMLPGENAIGNFDRYTLTDDTLFSISGSQHNDGWFIANSNHAVKENYVRVFMEADKARPFVAESAGKLITIQLGYNDCDHTLEACKLRNNTQNYGGSPGIAGGVYG